MTLELKNGRYISSVWYIVSEIKDKDFFAYVYRDEAGPWVAEWRFRYYNDNLIFGSSDERNWHGASMNREAPESKVTDAMDLMTNAVKEQWNGKLWRVRIESSNPEVFHARLRDLPFAHFRVSDLPS